MPADAGTGGTLCCTNLRLFSCPETPRVWACLLSCCGRLSWGLGLSCCPGFVGRKKNADCSRVDGTSASSDSHGLQADQSRSKDFDLKSLRAGGAFGLTAAAAADERRWITTLRCPALVALETEVKFLTMQATSWRLSVKECAKPFAQQYREANILCNKQATF